VLFPLSVAGSLVLTLASAAAVLVPGCPPTPAAIMQGILTAINVER
jgi:Ni,Fe-hydrogenase III small subunit